MKVRRAAAVAFAIATVLPGAAQAAPARSIATIVATSGLVRFRPADGEWITIKAPHPLRHGDTLKTLSGRAVIEFSDGAKVRVGRLSTFELKPPAVPGSKGLARRVMFLYAGMIRAIVRPLKAGEEFEVASAYAVAAVKGTDFVFDGKTVLVFDEKDPKPHSVKLSDARGARVAEVGEGQTATVGDDGVVSPVKDVPAGVIQKWRDAVGGAEGAAEPPQGSAEALSLAALAADLSSEPGGREQRPVDSPDLPARHQELDAAERSGEDRAGAGLDRATAAGRETPLPDPPPLTNAECPPAP